MITTPWWFEQTRMPIEEEVRMFHRLQFYRNATFVLGLVIIALIVGLVSWEKTVIESTQPEFRGTPQVEIMREPAAKKIDNNTRA